jgi:hypothetical protein
LTLLAVNRGKDGHREWPNWRLIRVVCHSVCGQLSTCTHHN